MQSPPPPPPVGQPGGPPQFYAPGMLHGMDAPGSTPSMVLGIISVVLLPFGCCCGIPWLISAILGGVALALGFQARGRIAASNGTLGGSGKAMAGIVMGGISVGLGVLLLVIYVVIFGISSVTSVHTGLTLPSPSP